MASLNIGGEHKLTAAKALPKVKELLGQAKKEHADKISDLREDWRGNRGTFSFRVMGFAVSGTLEVDDGWWSLTGTIPFAALPFKGAIEQVVRERADALLS